MTAQDGVDRLRHVAVDDHVVALDDLDHHVEGGRRLTLQHGLLRPPPARLLVAKGDRLDAAHQVGEGRVEHQVVEGVAVRGAHQLHAPLGDGPCGRRLQLGPALVDDDHLGHVVLHRLDHHRVLLGGRTDLHAARVTDPRVRDVAVAGDLVAGVDHHHPLAEVVGQYACHLAQHGGLAHARPAQQQDRAPGLDDVADDLDGPEDRPTDAAGEPDHLAGAVADGGDAVQGALDTGPIVVAEDPDVVDHVRDIGVADLPVEEHLLAVHEARLGPPAKVHHHLEQVAAVRERAEALDDLGGERCHQRIEVIGHLLARDRGHACSCLG